MSGPSEPKPRILVVDDEPRMGKAMERLLAQRYRVAVVASAAKALDLLASDPDFDGIICDLMMPQMSGMDLYDALRTSRPKLARRMVFMTGGAYTDEAHEFLAQLPQRRLDKPFRPEELERVLEASLRL
ncbi:MAG TPA: response regulator [Anaeromyxobacteraceae bacterium]|nr:response regulator [Anaeromyxobacteraceae bacterium]